MTWIAKTNIGDYKVGDVIPEEQALVWNQMFKQPVAQQEVSEVKPEPVKEEPEVELPQPSKKKGSKKKKA